jgi:hypothetical protein
MLYKNLNKQENTRGFFFLSFFQKKNLKKILSSLCLSLYHNCNEKTEIEQNLEESQSPHIILL